MNRSSFIKSLSLLGMGAMFTPKLFALVSSSGMDLTVPQSEGQVRHGIFNPKQFHNPLVPKWFKPFTEERLFANGYCKGDSDLLVFQFEVMDVSGTVYRNGRETRLRIGNKELELGTEKAAAVISTSRILASEVPSGSRLEMNDKEVLICIPNDSSKMLSIHGNMNRSLLNIAPETIGILIKKKLL